MRKYNVRLFGVSQKESRVSSKPEPRGRAREKSTTTDISLAVSRMSTKDSRLAKVSVDTVDSAGDTQATWMEFENTKIGNLCGPAATLGQ